MMQPLPKPPDIPTMRAVFDWCRQLERERDLPPAAERLSDPALTARGRKATLNWEGQVPMAGRAVMRRNDVFGREVDENCRPVSQRYPENFGRLLSDRRRGTSRERASDPVRAGGGPDAGARGTGGD